MKVFIANYSRVWEKYNLTRCKLFLVNAESEVEVLEIILSDTNNLDHRIGHWSITETTLTPDTSSVRKMKEVFSHDFYK